MFVWDCNGIEQFTTQRYACLDVIFIIYFYKCNNATLSLRSIVIITQFVLIIDYAFVYKTMFKVQLFWYCLQSCLFELL